MATADALMVSERSSYTSRRDELETYFDRTAADAWAALTSDAPVSRVRATVRAGRDAMRETLLHRLGDDLAGRAVLDAGCGTGALAVAAASRGAAVTAVDLAPRMIEIARERSPLALGAGEQAAPGHVAFEAGDMLAPAGPFDHVVAMDSLIHYRLADIIAALVTIAPKTRRSILFTVAPRTPALAAMHTVGKLFPRGDRSPAIAPVALPKLFAAIDKEPALADFEVGFTKRIKSGFYTSQAVELVRV